MFEAGDEELLAGDQHRPDRVRRGRRRLRRGRRAAAARPAPPPPPPRPPARPVPPAAAAGASVEVNASAIRRSSGEESRNTSATARITGVKASNAPAAAPATAGSNGDPASSKSPNASAASCTAGSTASRIGRQTVPERGQQRLRGWLTGCTASGAPVVPSRVSVSTIR